MEDCKYRRLLEEHEIDQKNQKIKSNSENENNSESEGGKNDYQSPEEKHQQIYEKMMVMKISIVNQRSTEMTSQEPGICKIDPWLKPFAPAIKHRLESYKK
ncbi:hypothetical protein RhiirA4_542176 [Rhizophagus irregularis]|uniref:Uncharacterized protein n=1 Tax=Rhizophagus irregularis TaxID=588596 RepID=A0A2I1GE37_9GLOM|nr:hypothetical protein RhiirA4_542176 [Rhizophagus irregularis]